MQRLSLALAVGWLVVLGATACQTSDVGNPCGSPDTTVSGDPISGEDPNLVAVRMERDGACQSFECLTHMGLPPYCTQNCSYVKGKHPKACTTNTDCTKPKYCYQGICQDDDCPAGFWCRSVQDVGPLAGQTFCVRRTCSTNFDCEDLGHMACKQYDCFDICDKDPTVTCATHQWTCQAPGNLQCQPSADLTGSTTSCQLPLTCQNVSGYFCADQLGVCVSTGK